MASHDDSSRSTNSPRLQLGQVSITPAASVAIEAAGVQDIRLLWRHLQGDWGDLPRADRLQNEVALILGWRVLSRYPLPTGKVVWITTEADRSRTTIMLADDSPP